MPDPLFHFLSGYYSLPWWGYVAYTLVVTHMTIISVTIYLHRYQTHWAIELHPVLSHCFRFWLWLTTGMVTKEWVATHRKHHAKVETADDPHSPKVYGIKKVMWDGTALYRKESANPATLERYGRFTPDDWIERHLYSRFSKWGVISTFTINIALFGLMGLAISAIQMAWIPIFAAGVINGIGHHRGYRNFETNDASHNICRWGILIGGEELHNNHHQYPQGAKFSREGRGEFDVSWLYIRIFKMMGLAKVKYLATEE